MILIKFFAYKLLDFYRTFRARLKGIKPVLHLWGIEVYSGIMGSGKTMALSRRLTNLRMVYGQDIAIVTNFGYKYENISLDGLSKDEMLNNLIDLVDKYRFTKPLIIGFDEGQETFDSRDWKTLDRLFSSMFAQVRKGRGCWFLFTTQAFEELDIKIKRRSQWVHDCRTISDRLTRVRKYLPMDYNNLITTSDVNLKMLIKLIQVYSFVQTDFLRSTYDSF